MPLIQHQSFSAIWCVVELPTWGQAFQYPNTFDAFRPKLGQIYLEGKVRDRLLHTPQDAQLMAFNVDFYKKRQPVKRNELLDGYRFNTCSLPEHEPVTESSFQPAAGRSGITNIVHQLEGTV